MSLRRSSLAAIALLATAAACAGDKSTTAATTWTVGDTLHVRIDRVIPREEVRSVVVEKVIEGEVRDSLIFSDPKTLRMSQDGSFILADGDGYGRVLIFSADGSTSFLLGREGEGPGEHQGAYGGVAALSNGDWAIFDTRNRRISVYDHKGVHKLSWPYRSNRVFVGRMLQPDANGGVILQTEVRVDPAKKESDRGAFVRTSPDSDKADTLYAPTFGVRQREFSVTKEVDGGVTTTGMIDQFSPGEGLAWHPSGFPVLLETGEYKLITRRNDKPLVVHRTNPAIQLQAEERRMNEDMILRQMKSVDANWTWPDGASPSTKPAASSVSVMSDGNIWVAVNVASERVTYKDSTGKEHAAFPSPVEFEVFSPGGELQFRVGIPSKFHLQDANGSTLWAFQFGDNDEKKLVKLRLEPPRR